MGNTLGDIRETSFSHYCYEVSFTLVLIDLQDPSSSRHPMSSKV